MPEKDLENLPERWAHGETIPLGEAIASDIEYIMGFRMDFPDGDGELQNLKATLNALRETTVDQQGVIKAFEGMALGVVKTTADKRFGHLRHMLQLGKILVVDEENPEQEHDWAMLGNGGNEERYSPVLDEVNQSFPDEVTQHALIDSARDDAMEQAYQQTNVRLGALFQELLDVIPPPHHHGHQGIFMRMMNIAVSLTSSTRLSYKPYDEFNSRLPHNDLKRISRKARKMNEVLEKLRTNPEEFLATIALEDYQEELVDKTELFVDDLVAIRNTEAVRAYGLGSKPGRPVAPLEESVTVEEIPVAASEATEVSSDRAKEQSFKEEVEELGKLVCALPWVDDGKPKAQYVDRLTYQGRAIYIMRGMSGKLEGIAEDVRDKSPTNIGETNQFDAMAREIAKKIASGIRPYDRRNNMKKVLNVEGEGYKGMAIWYPYAISPNAPRLYFTLKPAEEIMTPSVREKHAIASGAECVVILGETDMANQIEVLKAFTGLSRASLRNQGAGAV